MWLKPMKIGYSELNILELCLRFLVCSTLIFTCCITLQSRRLSSGQSETNYFLVDKYISVG